MTTAFTYTTLVEELQKHLGDEGDAFVDRLSTLISLGELKTLVELDLEIFDVTSENLGNMVAGTATIEKPEGFLTCTELFYYSSSARVQLDRRRRSYIHDYAPNPTTQAVPKYYAEEHTDTTILLGPTPNDAYQWGASYMKRPDGLSDSTATTWLSTNAGDLLFRACLIASEQWTKNDERIPVWKTEYTELLAHARQQFANLVRKPYSMGIK